MPVVKSKFLDDIIKGWNEKLKFNNVDLTNLVPFVQLYALYDSKETDLQYANPAIRIRNNEPMVEYLKSNRKSDTVQIIVTDKEKPRPNEFYYTGIEIAKLESQISSTNFKGGVGIESIKVNRGTRESFLSKYDMELVVTDVDIFKEQIEYTSLYSLNQNFLIMHGWTSTKMGEFIKPPIVTSVGGSPELRVNMNDNHKGYWMTSIVSLQKFRFSLDQQSHLRCNLTFLSSVLSQLVFKRTSDFSKNVLKDLQTPTFSTIDTEVDIEDVNRIKKIIIENAKVVWNKEGTSSGQRDANLVYILESTRSIQKLTTLFNKLKQLIDQEIKKEVNFSQLTADQSASFQEEWDKVEGSKKFKDGRSNIINDISIELRSVKYYIEGAASVGVVDISNRAEELAHHLFNRGVFFDAWFRTLKNGVPNTALLATLGDMRDILSKDIELNRKILYGTHLHRSMLDSENFKSYNPIYDKDADRSQFDDSDSLLELPVGATINTLVTTKIIKELNPPTIMPDDGLFAEQNVQDHPGIKWMYISRGLENESGVVKTVNFRRALFVGSTTPLFGHVVVNSQGQPVADPTNIRNLQYVDEFGNPTLLRNHEFTEDTISEFEQFVAMIRASRFRGWKTAESSEDINAKAARR
jgi:hypothetical protein|tara:strand:- start:3875 stop:5785 length:1911 start_codon:yes stop_codon:yes gene_type:complete